MVSILFVLFVWVIAFLLADINIEVGEWVLGILGPAAALGLHLVALLGSLDLDVLLPPEGPVTLVVDALGVRGLVGDLLLDLADLGLYFAVDLEGSAPLRATEAGICVQINAVTSELVQVIQVRVVALLASHWDVEYFIVGIKNLYFYFVSVLQEFVQVVILEILIRCLHYLLESFLFHYIQGDEKENWLSVLVSIIILVFHAVQTYFNILASTFVENLVLDENLVQFWFFRAVGDVGFFLYRIAVFPVEHAPTLYLNESQLNGVFFL